MVDMAELIKAKRVSRGLSLRQLGKEIGVTPAYVADLEANRRLPSPELIERLASALAIPVEDLEAADNRLSPSLREWIEERPQLTSLLRSLSTDPDSDTLIQRLVRFISRRTPPKPVRGALVTWESELRAIAAEASAWSVETGGDLFGRWSDVPLILLATRAGPKAQRNNAHFRLDVEYLRQLSETLASDWALRYFGDWHSHHRLGLSTPSGGDQKRILQLAARNQFQGMAEIIVTLEGNRNEPMIRIHPWLYDLSGKDSGPFPLQVKVLPGLSPIRQALLSRRVLPEQDLSAWERVSLQRVRIGANAAAPVLEPPADVDMTTRERTLSQLAEALQTASGAPVEQHATGFGRIIVAQVKEPHYLAFALGAAWPMPVLEVHRLNRATGTTEPIKARSGLVAPDVSGVVEVFRAEKGQTD
jgi:transcriptional regulator with XRE-family HTH domain